MGKSSFERLKARALVTDDLIAEPPADLRYYGIGLIVHTGAPQHHFGNACVSNEEDRTATAYHVTDRPERVGALLRSGRPLVAGRDEGKYGDLGPGLYLSAVPEYWVGRSTGKWDFLGAATEKQRKDIATMLAKRIEDMPKGYISENERERALRWLDEWKGGLIGDGAVVALADQPYNIRWWESRFLASIGIVPSKPPVNVRVRFAGWFGRVGRTFDCGSMPAMRAFGLDGIFHPGGWVSNPELVIWENAAVLEFGDFER